MNCPEQHGTPTPPTPLRILLVAHTHWDREWYHTAGRFRQCLVALVDDLLVGAADAGAPFLLDGQTIVLEDYLTVRPDRADALRGRLRGRAVEAGPWYVLADGLIPSGEAILRNLEAGRRDMEGWGARAPGVLYCPDTFGHASALPLIAAGYGFELIIAWRGLGGMQHPRTDTMWWRAPNGARVLVHHLPPDGYETGSALPVAADGAAKRWSRLLPLLAERNSTGVTLLTNGADHHALQPALDEAIVVANGVLSASGAALQRVSLADAAREMAVAARAYEAHGVSLPEIVGELRDSYGYTWTLQGTFATRAHQKRRNARLERALLRDVEPWIALAWLHGKDGHSPERDGQLRMDTLPSLLRHAWRTLLRTHPHDTLCGCSIDAVARAMAAAQDDTASQVDGLRAAALSVALGHSSVAGRALPPDLARRVLVRNRAAYPRGGVARLRILGTLADVPVGPGNAAAPRLSVDPLRAAMPQFGAAAQRLRVGVRHHRRESPQHYPDNDLVLEHHALAWIPVVPAHGVLTLAATTDGIVDENVHTAQRFPFAPAALTYRGDRARLENGRVAVDITPEGVSLSVGQRTVPDVLQLEAQHDAGDSYTPSLRGEPVALRMLSLLPKSRGPLRASCTVYWGGDSAFGGLLVITKLMLDAESDILQVHVGVRNLTRDHRLRLRFRTGVSADAETWADAAFGPVQRRRISAPVHTAETPPATMPLHRWIASADATRGAAMLSDGLAEGESGDGYLAVTLLRAIGELSRDDLPERPGHAGWPAPIPDAQCLRSYRARVGLLLHGARSDDTLATIERAADEFLLPLVGETFRDEGALPDTLSGPALEGDGLRASAVTIARNGDGLILRAINASSRDAVGTWRLPVGAWSVTPCRLDETPTGPTQHVTDRIDFTIAARDVLTFLVARAAD